MNDVSQHPASQVFERGSVKLVDYILLRTSDFGPDTQSMLTNALPLTPSCGSSAKSHLLLRWIVVLAFRNLVDRLIELFERVLSAQGIPFLQSMLLRHG